MKPNGKTIRQIADEIGVSKTAIRKNSQMRSETSLRKLSET